MLRTEMGKQLLKAILPSHLYETLKQRHLLPSNCLKEHSVKIQMTVELCIWLV